MLKRSPVFCFLYIRKTKTFGMISIDDILVSDEILTEYFACDYEVCKGACCVIGESGAPLEKDEGEKLQQAWPGFRPIMTECGRKCVAAKGFYEIDGDGDMVTPLMDMPLQDRAATGNKTLYAKWSKNTYKITYKLNSGKNSTKNPKTYTVTTKTITLKNPTRKGYTFQGWYSDAKFKTKVTKIAKGSTGNKTLYAKWKKN